MDITKAARSDSIWAASEMIAREFAKIPPISSILKIKKQIMEATTSFLRFEFVLLRVLGKTSRFF